MVTVIVIVASFWPAAILAFLTVMPRGGVSALRLMLPFSACVTAWTRLAASAALVAALRTLQTERIALIHPPWFSDSLDALGASYFQSQGVEVLEHGQAKLTKDYGDMTLDAIFDWVVSHTPDDAGAAVIGGGGFRATGAIAAIEGRLGRPVLSANQAAFWVALRVSGIDDRLHGYGRLFETQLNV